MCITLMVMKMACGQYLRGKQYQHHHPNLIVVVLETITYLQLHEYEFITHLQVRQCEIWQGGETA